jgi:hypothetical protein
MKNKIFIQAILVVLLACWHGTLYADEAYNLPFYQYFTGEFFKGKTEILVKKYQLNDKEMVKLAYLPLMNVIITTTNQPDSAAILSDTLHDYLALMADANPSIELVPLEMSIKVAQVLRGCDDFITSSEKVLMIKKLVEPMKVDVIVTGRYLEKTEDNTIKVKFIVVSINNKEIMEKVLVFKREQLICDSHQKDASKVLCQNIYKELVPTIDAIIFGSDNSDNKVGILSFSKLTSDGVKKKIGRYYNGLESEFLSTLKEKGFSIELTEYPNIQQPFTYDEMNAPPFDIDPDDFATPEQVLLNISKNQGLDKIIFGHLEEVSDFLYLVVRVYSRADNEITSVQPIQKIKIEELEVKRIEIAFNEMAMKIAELLAQN